MDLSKRLMLGTLQTFERLHAIRPTSRAGDQGRYSQRFEVALRHGTWKKFFNFTLTEIQLRLGFTKVKSYPYEWEIDTTNICQLKCPLCHTGLDNLKRPKGVMHFDTYKKVIDEIKDYCIWLSLYSWGEPFLNREIAKFIEYANKANVATLMSSNLNKPLTPQQAESIITAGLDVLIVSLDGVTQEVYEKYRVGGRLDRLLNNLQLLIDTRRRLGSHTPYVEWQFIVMRQNEHQIGEARALAQEMGVDGIVFKKVDFPHGEDDSALAKKWLPVNTPELRRDNPFDKPYFENSVRCWRLWRSGIVNWDGGYAPCCYLTDASQDFGDVNTHSIKEIWNSQHYQSARGLFKGGFPPKVELGCTSCNVFLESKAGQKLALTSTVSKNGHKPIPVAFMREAKSPKR